MLNYNSEAFIYRDLYSSIMNRPSRSAERQGENEEENVRPGPVRSQHLSPRALRLRDVPLLSECYTK
ncbi:hypothetical protein DI386_26385 [Escherichia coli]|nr:hypothetical protein DI386_26385 [Escherichia coli]